METVITYLVYKLGQTFRTVCHANTIFYSLSHVIMSGKVDFHVKGYTYFLDKQHITLAITYLYFMVKNIYS